MKMAGVVLPPEVVKDSTMEFHEAMPVTFDFHFTRIVGRARCEQHAGGEIVATIETDPKVADELVELYPFIECSVRGHGYVCTIVGLSLTGGDHHEGRTRWERVA